MSTKTEVSWFAQSGPKEWNPAEVAERRRCCAIDATEINWLTAILVTFNQGLESKRCAKRI